MKTFLFLVPLFAFCFTGAQTAKPFTFVKGAVVRGDSMRKELALVFTADEWGEGLPAIRQTLKASGMKAAFFFTGRFYRNRKFTKEILLLKQDGHYLGPHSDQHLLYCDWQNRDSLLVTKDSFEKDLRANLLAMKKLGLRVSQPHWFIPPFEWWNDSIALWSRQMGFNLFNFTPGFRTAADYTWPELPTYKSSNWLYENWKQKVEQQPQLLHGAILLLHAGTDPRRVDKFYRYLEMIIGFAKQKGCRFVQIDDLLR